MDRDQQLSMVLRKSAGLEPVTPALPERGPILLNDALDEDDGVIDRVDVIWV
jgi:hypothetical protein